MRSAMAGVIGVMSLCTATASAEPLPIVAIFDLQSKGAPLGPESLDGLTDVLAARVAATGRHRTVPRSQIRDRLTRLKLESYRDCYDQACHIELGRELAASKALSSRVVLLDGECVLTLELHDLRSASTEFAHTTRGPCTEGQVMRGIFAGVKALAAWASRRGAGSRPAAAPPAEKVAVYVRSDPPGSEIVVEGTPRGVTPARVTLDRGRTYRVTLHRDDHRPVTRPLVAEEGVELSVPLELTSEARLAAATSAEWMGLGMGPTYLHASRRAGLAVGFRVGTLKWPRFFWTILEVSMCLSLAESASPGTYDGSAFQIGSRAGLPLYFGGRGQHQLLLGLGASVQVLAPSTSADAGSSGESPHAAFALSPGLDYVYNAFGGLLPLGLGLRAQLPVAGDLGERYPFQLLSTINVGFSLSRLAVLGAGRAARARTVP